jgi:hypothetical protein
VLGGEHSATAEAAGVVVRVSIPGRVSQPGSAAGLQEVPQELELLKGINAFATPGNLVALMGGSGGLVACGCCPGLYYDVP